MAYACRSRARWTGGALGRGGALAVGPGVAGLGVLPDEAGQVGEEGELLPHQRAVDAVLTSDLGEQAAQLGGALAGRVGGAGADERAEALERDLRGRNAERGAGALQQRGALLLEGAAAAHLGLHVGEARQDGFDVAVADRLALVEHEAEQTAGGVDLRVQVDEQLGFENRAHAESFRSEG